MALERIGIKIAMRTSAPPNTMSSPRGFIAPCGHIIATAIWERYKSPDPVPHHDNMLFYSTPQSWTDQRAAKRRGVGFTMFECDEIPESWVPLLSMVDMMLVPSEFNREVFAKHFPVEKIHVAPLGVNAWDFPYKERRRDRPLKFLHFSTLCTEYRKGADLAFQAFEKAFPNRDDVYLEINCRTPRAGLTEEQVLQLIGVTPSARVRVCSGLKTVAELRDLFYDFDCMIYPSRGEGFGLIPLEAMASGLPVIHTGETGMRAYADLGLTVRSDITKAYIGRGRLDDEVVQTWHGTTGQWYEPNLDDLVDRMREVDREYKFVQAKAARDSKAIAERFTWDQTARAIQAALEGWG